jgi:3-oxoacyl-[acyl-carrier-protein] synthase I
MSDVAITGLHVVCPVGLTAAHACAAIRAGVSRVAAYDGYVCIPPEGPLAALDEGPEPIMAGLVPLGADDLDGSGRLSKLALLTLQGIVSEAGLRRQDLQRTALLVCLPAPDGPVASWTLGPDFTHRLCALAGIATWAKVVTLAAGPAGALRAMDAARLLLAEAQVDFCLVLMVDSLIDSDRLAALDEAWRLRSLRNPDGFLPGEAGAAVLLERKAAAERRGASLLGVVGRMSTATEPGTVKSERWSSSKGLCAAISPLLDGPQGEVGRYVLCDLNGESYRSQEWGVTQSALARELPPMEALVHPAQSIGDAGTAMAGVLIACACESFVHGYAPAKAALLWAGCDGGERTALVVRAANAGRG